GRQPAWGAGALPGRAHRGFARRPLQSGLRRRARRRPCRAVPPHRAQLRGGTAGHRARCGHRRGARACPRGAGLMRAWRAPLGTVRAPAGRLLAAAPPPDADAGPLLDEDVLRQIERLSLADRGALTDGLMGEHGGRRKTQAIEFADYRGYVPGDDFRLIDWNAYARLGELFVRTSLAQENVTLTLLLDCSRSMDWGRPNKLRYAKRLA